MFVDGDLYFGWWWNTYSPFHVSPSITSLSSRVATRSKIRHQLNQPLLLWTFAFILIFFWSYPHIRVSLGWTIFFILDSTPETYRLHEYHVSQLIRHWCFELEFCRGAIRCWNIWCSGENCFTKKSFPKAHLFPCSLIMANGESPLGHFTLWLRDKRKGKVGRKVRKNKLFRRILFPLKTWDS